MSYLSFVIRDKKWGVVLGMRVVMFLGGELVIGDIFVKGSVFFFRDVVRTYVFFFFSSLINTLFLLCDSKPCTYDVIYIFIY